MSEIVSVTVPQVQPTESAPSGADVLTAVLAASAGTGASSHPIADDTPLEVIPTVDGPVAITEPLPPEVTLDEVLRPYIRGLKGAMEGHLEAGRQADGYIQYRTVTLKHHRQVAVDKVASDLGDKACRPVDVSTLLRTFYAVRDLGGMPKSKVRDGKETGVPDWGHAWYCDVPYHVMEQYARLVVLGGTTVHPAVLADGVALFREASSSEPKMPTRDVYGRVDVLVARMKRAVADELAAKATDAKAGKKDKDKALAAEKTAQKAEAKVAPAPALAPEPEASAASGAVQAVQDAPLPTANPSDAAVPAPGEEPTPEATAPPAKAKRPLILDGPIQDVECRAANPLAGFAAAAAQDAADGILSILRNHRDPSAVLRAVAQGLRWNPDMAEALCEGVADSQDGDGALLALTAMGVYAEEYGIHDGEYGDHGFAANGQLADVA